MTKSPFPRSLGSRILLQMALRVAIVIAAASALGYYFVYRSVEQSTLETLGKYVSERGERESQPFQNLQNNLGIIASAYLDEITKPVPANTGQEFNRLFMRNQDGAWRRRPEGHDISNQPGSFVSSLTPLTPDAKRRILATMHLTTAYGNAWHNQMATVFLASMDGLYSTYWPGFDWAKETKSTQNFAEFPWVINANKLNDPSRSCAWMPIWYDWVGKDWFTTCIQPVDVKGKFRHYAGGSISLDDILKRTSTSQIAGTYNVIFRSDGLLISHPLYVDKIKQSNGKYNLKDGSDPHLLALFQMATQADKGGVIELKQFNEYLGVARIKGPNWYFVTVFPRNLIAVTARKAAQTFLWLGIASLVLEMLILYLIIRRQITAPLRQFAVSASRIRDGDLGTRCDIVRMDELGDLATSFNDMADAVQANSKILEANNLALEGRVTERTRELDDQNVLLENMNVILRQKESALRESEQFLREAQSIAGLGSYVLDIATGRWSGTDSILHMFGMGEKHEKTFEQWIRLLHPDDCAIVADYFADMLLTRTQVFDKKYRIIRLDDKAVRWIHGLGNLEFDEEGQPLKMIGTIQDVTEQHEREAELMLSRDQLRVETAIAETALTEAEQANLAKTKFLAAASHDLRQPAHALGMLIATLHAVSQQAAIEPGRIAYIAERLQTALDGLGHLMNGLLDISRLDAEVIHPAKQTVALTQKLEALYYIFSELAAAKGLELRIMPCSLAVDADPFLLHRILCNLVANAVRYTEHGRILVGCRRRKGQVEIQILDTGIGIAQDQLGNIFTEFFQVNNVARTREKGLGLGLSIVQRSAELLDTKVFVSSIPGKGSGFSFSLPLATSEYKPVAELLQPHNPESMTLLVIDDDRDSLDAMQTLLTAWGHVAVPAASLNEAVAAAKRTSAIGFILADYRLSDNVTGIDAIRAVFACLGHAIPAAIITGDTAPERIREASKGGYAVLHKPLAAAQLRDLLDRTIVSPVQPGM